MEGTWQLSQITSASLENVMDRVHRGLILCPGHENKEKWPQTVKRLWIRDQKRIHDARQRASGLLHHPFPCRALTMAQRTPGLGPADLPLKDLLSYLSDATYHYPHGYQRDADGKLVPPFVATAEGWHCSRCCDWVTTPASDARAGGATHPPPGLEAE